MRKKAVYIFLCLLGLWLPYSQFVPWLLANGLNVRLLTAELAGSRLAMFFVWDVVVSAATLAIFLRIEAQSLRIRHVWLVPVAIVTVGVSLGLPLFLYLRQRALEEPGRLKA